MATWNSAGEISPNTKQGLFSGVGKAWWLPSKNRLPRKMGCGTCNFPRLKSFCSYSIGQSSKEPEFKGRAHGDPHRACPGNMGHCFGTITAPRFLRSFRRGPLFLDNFYLPSVYSFSFIYIVCVCVPQLMCRGQSTNFWELVLSYRFLGFELTLPGLCNKHFCLLSQLTRPLYLFVLFETGTLYVALAGLELAM